MSRFIGSDDTRVPTNVPRAFYTVMCGMHEAGGVDDTFSVARVAGDPHGSWRHVSYCSLSSAYQHAVHVLRFGRGERVALDSETHATVC